MKPSNPIFNSLNKDIINSDIKMEDIERNTLYLSLLMVLVFILSLGLYINNISIYVVISSLVLSISFFFISYKKKYKKIYGVLYTIFNSIFYAYTSKYLYKKLALLNYNDMFFINDNSVLFITISASIIFSIFLISTYYVFFDNVRSFTFIYLSNMLIFMIPSIILIVILSNLYSFIDIIPNMIACFTTSLIFIFLSIYYHEERRRYVDEGINKNDLLLIEIIPISLLTYGISELINLLVYKNKNN